MIRVAEGHLSGKVLELESSEYIKYKVNDFLEFFLQLVRTHKQVSVILSKASHTCKSVKLTTLLITVNSTELSKSQRKILVRPRL